VEEDDLPIFEKIKAQGGYPGAPAPGNHEIESRRPEKKLSLIPAILIFLRNTLQLPEKKETAIRRANPRLPARIRIHAAQIPAAIPAEREKNNSETLSSLYQATARIYKALAAAEPGMLTASFLEGLHNDLDAIIEHLTPLTDPDELESPAIIDGLIIARNKLDFALALFDIEEVDPLYRLVIRNKVVPRVRILLGDVLQCWPGVIPYGGLAPDPFERGRGGHLFAEAGYNQEVSSWKRGWTGWIVRMLAGLAGDRQTHAPFRTQPQDPPKEPSASPPKNPPPPKDAPPKPQKNSPTVNNPPRPL
jgi:hypothetical protein